MAAKQTKPFWQSSTIWINLLPVIVIVLEELIVGGVVPKEGLLYMTVILNILNRFNAPSKVSSLTIK